MANKDNPRGLQAVDSVTGGDYIGTFRNALIKSAYADNLAKGDPFKYVADANAKKTYIERAGADDDIDGVFMGCAYKKVNQGFGTQRVSAWSGGTVVSEGEVVADVILDKSIEFVVQVANPNNTADHADNVIDASKIGQTVKIVATEAGDSDPLSRVELDAKNVAASGNALELVRPYKGLNNDVEADFGKWVVKIVE